MGLQQAIGYRPPRRAWWRQAINRLASTRAGSWMSARLLHRIDRFWFRRTGAALSEHVSGLPTVLLTTTGARSGQPRTLPLVGFPSGDDLAVIGTNWGGSGDPAWVYNLRARPRAVVEYRGHRVEVRAGELHASAADEVWRRAEASYPGYGLYPERSGDRRISVFRLHPDV